MLIINFVKRNEIIDIILCSLIKLKLELNMMQKFIHFFILNTIVSSKYRHVKPSPLRSITLGLSLKISYLSIHCLSACTKVAYRNFSVTIFSLEAFHHPNHQQPAVCSINRTKFAPSSKVCPGFTSATEKIIFKKLTQPTAS